MEFKQPMHSYNVVCYAGGGNMDTLLNCLEFVKRVDTLMPRTEDYELTLYRKVGAIIEEIEEYRVANSSQEAENERRDVQFYMLSFLNFTAVEGVNLDNKVPALTPHQFMGRLKKKIRSGEEITPASTVYEVSGLRNWCYECLTDESSNLELEEDFIDCMTEKLQKKFPEHCVKWGLMDSSTELQQRVKECLGESQLPTFDKQIKKGLKKYGKLLSKDPNGRDSIQDLREENMDGLFYTCQALMQGRKAEVVIVLRQYRDSVNKLIGGFKYGR